MNTRYNLRNLLPQCKKCNRFQGGKSRLFGKKIDLIWGNGTADEMERLSEIKRTWTPEQLNLIASAARKGWLVYLQVYGELEAQGAG